MRSNAHARCRKLVEEYGAFVRWIVAFANQGLPRTDLLRDLTKKLLDISGCDAVTLCLKEDERYYCCEASQQAAPSFRFETFPPPQSHEAIPIPRPLDLSSLEQVCGMILTGRIDSSSPYITKNGSFWTGDSGKPFLLPPEFQEQDLTHGVVGGGEHTSQALIPFVADNGNTGFLRLMSRQRNFFTRDDIEFYEGIAQTLGVAVANWRAQATLRERVKELTCLYSIAQVIQEPDISRDEMLQRIAELLPPAWQYPESAGALVVVDGRSYPTPGFREGTHKQTADIAINGKRRGFVEVVYPDKTPEFDESLFLKEEVSLINATARQIALVIERQQVEEESAKLQEQLRHADRLATIGQLAAGVAHELNEPLGSILGFAQLVKKSPDPPRQTLHDIDKIIAASLHAREVIKKLMLFARQAPQEKTRVNLNQMIKEGLYFFEARCVKRGIELACSLSPDVPEVMADPTQLNQVLINLVVNALQAMTEGGRLTVATCAAGDHVSLIVEDTGVGMSEDVMKKIFVPFFTTKDVDKGTGLGLPVVHGIVTSHGGSINVESKVGRGTRFEIRLPVTGFTG